MSAALNAAAAVALQSTALTGGWQAWVGPLSEALLQLGWQITLLGLAALAAWLRGTTLSNKRTPPTTAGWLLAGASLTVGVLLIQWGLRLGMPSFATQHGGSLHVFGGAVTVLFSVLMGLAMHRRAWGWAREWSWFLLACLLATPSLWWALPAVGALGLPTEYVQTGHAWRLAAYGQWMPLIGAFLCAIHSEATHAKLAR